MQGTSVGLNPLESPGHPRQLSCTQCLALLHRQCRTALLGGRETPEAGPPAQLVSSVIQSHVSPASTAASLAGQSQTRCQERTEFFISPHGSAKPVQRHLCWTT